MLRGKEGLGGWYVALPLSRRETRLPLWTWSFLAGLSSGRHRGHGRTPLGFTFQRKCPAYSVWCVHGKERHKQTGKVLVKP